MSLLDEVNKYRMKHPPDLLEIYDDDSLLMSHNAWARTGLDLYQLGIKNGKDGLINSLDKLLLEQKTFKRVLFNTHGNEGMILFKNQPIDAAWLKGLRGRGYERLFPFPKTRMYFAGCNVAEGTRGWNFLEAAGQTFLRIGGGVVFASTGALRYVLGWTTITGHMFSFGKTKVVFINPGGTLRDRFDGDIYNMLLHDPKRAEKIALLRSHGFI